MSAADPGAALAAERDTPQGRLQWLITVRDDGRLEHGGRAAHADRVAGRAPDGGDARTGPVTLRALTLRGLPDAAWSALRLRGVDHLPLPGAALRATLATPLGEVTL